MAKTELEDLVALTENWTPTAKAEAMARIKARTSVDRHIWYCKSPGRLCDGRPHSGYPYKHARGSQWPPPGIDWDVWFVMAGRGWGKTRTAAEWILAITALVGRIALVGRRTADVRTTMIEGESGLQAVCDSAGIAYDWKPALKEFTFANGAVAFGFSAEEPASLRGPQFGAAWLDEPAHMDLIDDVWDNLSYGLRIPGLPGGAKAVCTTTPLPIPFVKTLVKEPTTRLTRGHSDENADNLDEGYKRRVIEKRRGTRLGRQELAGEILEDVEGALWQAGLILVLEEEVTREQMDRIVVAIDPAGTANRKSDETGIIVVGKSGEQFYVLEDCSGKYSPEGWANAAINAYVRWQADLIVAEKNYGGDMVKRVLENQLREKKRRARIKVKTATRSKQLRAEPVVALYEQKNTVFHNPGLAKLEEEQTTWIPGKGDSPNRIDALVWGVDELDQSAGAANMAAPHGRPGAPLAAVRSASTSVLNLANPKTRLQLPPGFQRRPNR